MLYCTRQAVPDQWLSRLCEGGMIMGVIIGLVVYIIAVALLAIFMYGASGGKDGDRYE